MKTRYSSALRTSNLSTVAICVSALFLASCGGSSGGDDPVIIGGGSGTSADDVETSELLRRAATGTSTSLGKNITSMQRIGGTSSSMGLLLDSSFLNLVTASLPANSGEEPVTTNEVVNTNVESDIGDFMDSLLGLDEQFSVVTRTGNNITIDPDDVAFCEELADESFTAQDISNCQALVSEILVDVDAATEDTGLITVTFAQQDLLLIGYSPMAANYEVKLAGLQTLLTRAEQLGGGIGSVPNMQGAIRFSATVENETVNAESGSFSISVTEAINIVDNSGTSLTLQPSTLLSVTADAATNTASVELDVGALNAAVSTENEVGEFTTAALAFSGLTARMDISNDGDSLVVSNVGIGNGPLTFSIDSVEQLRLVMDTFGFSIDGDTGSIALNDNFDFELSSGLFNVLAANAPSGTAFAVQDNGSTQVTQGGPLFVSIVSENGGAPISDSISIGSGVCFGSNESFESTLPLAVADCDL